MLDIRYGFNGGLGVVAAGFVPGRLGDFAPALWFVVVGGFTAVRLLVEAIVSCLLDAMWVCVPRDPRVLFLVGYFLFRWAALAVAAARWAHLALAFITVDGGAVHLFDFVLLFGLHEGDGGFSVAAGWLVFGDALFPEPFGFPDVGVWRLVFVGIRRVGLRVLLLFDIALPLPFVEVLGAVVVLVVSLGCCLVVWLLGGLLLDSVQCGSDIAGSVCERGC
ncbi:hypothetical protein AZ036_004404 [Klebsiella michiganensis]|nr:hypothetical protein AZ036_004404 [Klebsiella michiganensis]